MKAFLLLCCIGHASALFDELLNGAIIHFGPYDDLFKIGNLTKRYSPLSKDDLHASRNARHLLEAARNVFNVGFYTLPPLDPYKSSDLPPMVVDKHFTLLSGIIHLNHFEMTGAKRFNLNLLEIRNKNGRIDFGFTLPHLNVKVDVQTNLLFADYIPVNIKGKLSLTLSKISVLGAGQVYFKKLVSQLSALHSRVHIGDVAFQFIGSQIDINKMLRESSLAARFNPMSNILDTFKEQLNEYVANFVFEEINKMLAGAPSPSQSTARTIISSMSQENFQSH
ncbi:unnamed protein product [Parnassius apollo]|uniref:(apollo) hypothetical protein n=1 Tax=Parnassius apollo TaxID=110799 RepID=A0A8S3WIJ2_PARAO|nr:unnamed protein product [Parnassius apollo]